MARMTETPSSVEPEVLDVPVPEPDLEVVEDGLDLRRTRRPLGFLLTMDSVRTVGRIVSLIVTDALAIYLAIFGALEIKSLLRGGATVTQNLDQAYSYATFAVLLTVLLFAQAGLYADRGSRPGLRAIVSSLFAVVVVAFIYAQLTGQEFSSYYIFWATFLFAVVLVGSARWAYDRVTGRLLKAAGYRRRALLVGAGQHASDVAAALAAPGRSSMEVVGIVEPEFLAMRLDDSEIDELIIAEPDYSEERVLAIVDECHERGVRVRVAPSTMEILVHRAEFVAGQAVPLFELKAPVFDGFDYAVKRAFDIIGAFLGMVLLSPLMLLIASLVKFTSRGPVFYQSIRPGIGGIPFACLKFRTMYQGADRVQHELEAVNEADGALFKIRHDPRVTPVGRVLRRFSLDELPQLWNVLRGEMSIVGPRPLPQRDYDQLEDWHRKRYLVLPGMTGLWQVSGRSNLDFDDLVRLDFVYIERWSLSLDLSIIFQTFPAVIRRRGAF
jgi:exopolysaccharide biosynthesis polyprenyl glycosylphosphotransferase